MVNLETKHGADERVLVDDLVFQTQAALSVARAIGQLTTRSSASVSSAAPSTITPAAASPSR